MVYDVRYAQMGIMILNIIHNQLSTIVLDQEGFKLIQLLLSVGFHIHPTSLQQAIKFLNSFRLSGRYRLDYLLQDIV